LDTGVRDMLSPYLQVARLALRGEPAILPVAEPWRDWIYAVDAAEALVALLEARVLAHHRSKHQCDVTPFPRRIGSSDLVGRRLSFREYRGEPARHWIRKTHQASRFGSH